MHTPARCHAALLAAALLWGCVPTQAPTATAQPAEAPPPAEPPPASPVATRESREARVLEALLREAEAALATNRLTTPLEDNALDHFLRALVLAPDDPRPRAGIEEIARRYQRWALRAAGNGETRRAEELLELAAQVSPGHPTLAATRVAVGRALKTPSERHELAGPDLDARAPALARQLARLGTRAKEEALFVVITAPVDGWSRWIYQQMNGAPPARRLRARSEVGPVASVELRTMD
ncbi:MAG: hypothetical protein V2J24_11390 [Pseudomonadales bacterium]|jgi:uncharacterized protein (DUF1778 family)|nr:hypothetical protein [Pseudomonadales bacterium]